MNGKSKMKKKLVSLLMVLALLVTMVPAAAFAQGDGSAKNPVVVYRNPSLDKAGTSRFSSSGFDVRSTTIDEWKSETAKSQGINVNSIEDVRYYIGTTQSYESFDTNYPLTWKPYSYWFGWNTAKPTDDRSSTETEKVKLYDASGNVMHTAEYLNVKVKNYITVTWRVDDTDYSSKIVLNSTLATTEYNNAVAAISEKVNKNDGKEWEFKGWDTDGNNATIEILPEDAEAYFAKVVDVTDADGCIAAKSVDGAVFKAVFKKKDYTVTWVDEDGTVLETDENVEYGETPEFNGKKPSKGDGEKVEYEFLGWSPATSPVTGDVTYKATYKEVDKKAYTVKFIYGDNNVSTTSVVEGNTVEKPADPVQDGYEFDGWYTDENYTTEFDFANTEINEDTDIYAKWLEVYTISFDANAEGVEGTMAPMYITEGVENTALTANAYKLPGYEFKGWTHKQGGDVVVYENEASITPDGNMTLYAVWEKIPAVDTEIVVEKTDVTVTYGEFTMEDIITAAAPKVMAGENEVDGAAVTTADDITNNNVGTYQVKLDYAGTVNARAATEYNASSTTINVTIVPAKAEVVVKSNAVKYGTAVEYPIKANCKTIDVIVGMDIHDETNLVGVAQAAVPLDLMFALGIVAGTDIDLNDMSIEDLETLLKRAEGIDDKLDLGIAKLKEYEDSIRELIDTLKAVQAELPMDTELKISVVPEALVIPENIGLYLVASILADDNYVAESADGSNANMDAGYLIIAPNGIKTDLTWNDTDDNDIITLDKKAKFDFEATAKIDESTLDGVKGYDDKGAQSHVEYLFVGVDGEGLVVDRCTDPNGAADALTVGAYAQVAYVANWDNIMYYGMPIARPVVVAPNVADVAIIDANGNENYAQAYTYGDDIGLAVTVDGKKAPVEGLTVKYIGSDTTVDGWYRDELPTDAGVYTVVATYTENDENGNLYKAGGAVGVLIINPADAEIGLEDAKYEYDGNEYFATITNDKFDYATVAIDRANNIAYVNLPEDTQAHVERLVAMLPADAEKAVNDQLAKYEGFDGDVQTSTLKKEMNDMLQAIIDADMTAAAKAEAKALMEALVEEFENNEDVKALAAKIESELKALKDKIGEEIPDDIEAEITQYIKDAVTVNEDGTVEIDTDKLEADLDKMISEMEGKLPASVVAELKEMKKEIVKAVENNIDIEAIEKEISDITTKIEGLDKEDIAKIAIAAAYEAYGSLDKEQIKELAKEAIYKIEAQGYIDYAEGMLESIKNMYGGDIDTTDLEAAIKDLIDDSEAAIKAGDIDADSLKSLENHIDKILAEMQGVIDQIPDGTIVFGKNPSEVGEYDCYAINISANYKAELVDAKLVIYEKEQTEDPKDPTNPTDPTDPTTPDQPKDDEIDTGDHSNMALPLVLATAALAAIVALFATRRRHS